MAQNNINQNGNFHTPLSPMRFQSSMGKEVRRKYKDGKNMVRLSLARVAKVNYKYNTVDVITIQDKNNTTKNPNDNGRYSARLPVQFGGQTPDGKIFGTNTLVTVGCLVLIGFLEGHKDNPIVLNIYGEVDNQSMLTRTTYTGADESDEALQQELWQLFTLYPSMTYKNIDGHGNQEVTFPGKTFFYASADDSRVNDAFFDYDHLPSSSYANGDLIEPTVPNAPNMLYVHQSLVDNHRVTFFVKSDGTVRVGSRHADGQGVTFWQLNTDGSFRIQQSNDTVDPEDKSSNFSSFSIEEDGTIVLQSGEHKLSIGSNGLLLDGGVLDGSGIDLSGNQTIKDMQGDITTIQKATTTDGIVSVVTDSTPWHNINQTVDSKSETFISQPAPPYNIGDIWKDGSAVYVCTTPKAIGATFAQTDWTLSADVTSQNTAADTTNVNGTPSSTVTSNINNAQSTANNAQTTAQAKSEMFLSQPTPPYNKGDIWNDNGVIYVSNISRPDGATFLQADWVKGADVTASNTANDTSNVNGTPSSTVTSNISNAQSTASNAQTSANNAQSTANTAQSTANSKAKTFTSTPTVPYSLGDMWNQNGKVYSCITAKSSSQAFNSADWVLVADMTSQNTAADTSAVNGTSSSTVISNINNAQSTASSAQTSANNAQSTANSAQSLASSKAEGFVSQPVPPYNTGDVWNNSGTVYICTTAKASGTTFAQADWTLAGDVTSNNTAKDTSAVNGVSSATVNSNISNAQTTANNAQSLATSKAKGFVSQPVPPYSQGDVWDNGGTVYICTTARSSGSFTQSDWTLSGDVTANNTAKDTAAVNGQSSSTLTSTVSNNTTAANNAQTTANSKAKTFTSQPTIPYNLGDIYKNGQTVYVCTTARSTGSYTASDFTLVGDVTNQNTAADTAKVNGQASSTLTSTVSSNTTAANNAQTSANNAQTAANNAQSTANSKAQGFVSQPVPPYSVGDVWNNSGIVYLCTTAKASGGVFSQADWTIAGDVTANNTAKDTSAVNGTSSSTVISNISNAQSTANSANTAASNAQTSANNAQTTANSKAQGFVSQPAPPYNVGDVWNNSGIVYLCTTAKASGGTFAQSDWTIAGDVTANNTAKDTSAVNGVASATVNSNISSAQTSANNAQTTANSKAKTFTTQPTVPYNVGDIYQNNGAVYICTTARSTGSYTASDWTLSGDVTSNNTAKDTSAVNGTSSSTVISNISNAQTSANNAQSTANSKAQTFTATPVPPYNVGDIYKNGSTVYVCTTAKASGTTYSAADFTLAGDVTANNTAHDTSNVNGTAASTLTSNVTTAQNTASNAQTAANNAQSTANSKAQTFTTTPAPPYNVGDIYKSGQTVYVCTTAKASGGTYAASDFTLVGDVTSQNTAADTTNVNGTSSSTVISNINNAQSTASNANTAASNAQTSANNAQTTANSKAQTFTATPAPPYNVGDIYKNGATVYVCTTAKASGGTYAASDFTLVGDVTANNTSADTSKVNGVASATVNSNISSAQTAANNAQTTANSKAKTYTSQPAPPYNLGDIYQTTNAVYICTTARSSGSYTASDWYLSGDVTGQNTAKDTSAVNGTSSSTVISNISNAQTSANNAQSTANSKAQTFTATPVPPYNVGDIYKNGATVYICTTAKASGGTYASSDFVLASDVTANNTANDTSNVNGTPSSTVNSNISNAQTSANNAQSTANSKAKTFTGTASPTVPYNVGDIWQNGATVYVCTTAKASGGTYASGDWTLASDVTANNTAKDTSAVNGVASATVNSNISSAQTAANNAQSTANSKAKTWTAQPAPPYSTGDVWQTTNAVYICTAGRSSGSYTASDWYLAGDVTAQNTAKDTSAVNGVASSTVNSNISSAQTAANNAQSTANSKAKTWTAQPTPPYSTGDIYQTTNAVYVCTAGRSSGSYTASDWYLAGDVTAHNTAADVTNVNGVAASTVTTNASNGNSAYSKINNDVGSGTIETTAGSQSKANSAVSNLVIGGRNYLRNTSNFADLTNWSLNVGSGVTVSQSLVTDATYGTVVDTYVSANGTTNNWIVIQNVGLTLPGGKFTVGNTYTLSFLMKNDLTMYVNFMDSNGTNAVSSSNSPTIPISTNWVKVVWTFTASATGNTPEFYLAANDSTHTGHIQITQIQLEDGSKATGYNPAPEDVNNQITTTQSSVNNILQGNFDAGSGLGKQIVSTVTGSTTYISDLNNKADSSDLANYATSDQLSQAKKDANSYTDSQIQGIDFSPYATTSSLSQTKTDLTAQFTASGGVNLLKNSIGHSILSDGVTPAFWTVVSGTPAISLDPTIQQYGASSGFMLNNATISQSVTVTPNQSYTISAVVLKGSAGTGSITISDTSSPAVSQTISLASGTAYTYQKVSVDITPATSTLTVQLSGDSASGGVMFTCVMLNIGTTAFSWQQAVGEVYNTNVNFDLNGIRVMSTDKNGKATAETIMTPSQFAGYSDLNGDGKIDTSTGSVDEVFRMDKDAFVMKNATIGPLKIVQVTGTHTGVAFIPNA